MLRGEPVGVTPMGGCLLGSTPQGCSEKKKFDKDGKTTSRCSSDCSKCGFNIHEAERRKGRPLVEFPDGLARKVV